MLTGLGALNIIAKFVNHEVKKFIKTYMYCGKEAEGFL